MKLYLAMPWKSPSHIVNLQGPCQPLVNEESSEGQYNEWFYINSQFLLLNMPLVTGGALPQIVPNKSPSIITPNPQADPHPGPGFPYAHSDAYCKGLNGKQAAFQSNIKVIEYFQRP